MVNKMSQLLILRGKTAWRGWEGGGNAENRTWKGPPEGEGFEEGCLSDSKVSRAIYRDLGVGAFQVRQTLWVRVWSMGGHDVFVWHRFWPHQCGERIHSSLTQSFLEQILLCARYSSPGIVLRKTEKVPSSDGAYILERKIAQLNTWISNTILDSGKKIKQDGAIKGKEVGKQL